MGGCGLLKATLKAYRAILASGIDYKYVLMVTGQDMMIREGLDKYLASNNGQAYIECINTNPVHINKWKRAMLLHNWPERYLKRMDFKFHPHRLMRSARMRLFMLFPNLLLKKIDYDISGMQFYYDKVWHAFPIEIVRYIISFLDENPGFWDIYENSFMADEGFFTTVIMNSQYRDRIVFNHGISKSIAYTNGSVNNHPPILTMDDLEKIDGEKCCFFARKFDGNVDLEIIDYYCSRIRG